MEFPAGAVLEVRTALSYVSIDGARANLAAEGRQASTTFARPHRAAWNAALSRITVAGADGPAT